MKTNFVSECLACMYVWAPHECLVPAEARDSYQIPWNCSKNRWIDELSWGCRESNLGPLQEPCMLLASEPSLAH